MIRCKIDNSLKVEELYTIIQELQQISKNITGFIDEGYLKICCNESDKSSILAMLKKHSIFVEKDNRTYKLVHREENFQAINIGLNNLKFDHSTFQVIAGPCAVETYEQIIDIAKHIKMKGATILRGGAFKPRSSPYSFQGLGAKGIELLLQAKRMVEIPIVTEIMDISQIALFEDVDIIQVGARNMQNYNLLKELGAIKKPILLKRGFGCTIKEFIMSAEYILKYGNSNVILCERGIRTFENSTRNTLDISAVPILKKETNLPVIVDPSHAAGRRDLIQSLTNSAIAVGADGIMIEVHNDPRNALSDGKQSLDFIEFDSLMDDLKKRVKFENRSLGMRSN